MKALACILSAICFVVGFLVFGVSLIGWVEIFADGRYEDLRAVGVATPCGAVLLALGIPGLKAYIAWFNSDK